MSVTIPKIKSVREQVYEGIKTLIVSGELPQGTRLQENDLAELFKVSRTPVREALKSLKDDGLLESGPGKGLVVRTLTEESAKDIFAIRSLLELYAIRIAARDMTPEQRRYMIEMRAKFEYFFTDYDAEEYIRMDTEFHNSIIKFSGNRFLPELSERVYSILQAARLLSLSVDKHNVTSTQRHIEIIDCMLNHDVEGAERALRTHLEGAEEKVRMILAKQKTTT